MLKKTRLCAGLTLAFGGLTIAALPAMAQSDNTQRVEITGSNIKRVDSETVAPVSIITRDQIERTGQPTAAEVIRALPINTGAYSEQSSNSFAPGAAGVSLRGLGQKTTLVLLNGRRTAGYGFAQNLQDTFVDLNSIPAAAIDRIEILRDGASALYGSDAIAGVVNIILRKDYKGFEGSVSVGTFEAKSDRRVTLATGMGDLGKDGYNIFATVDAYSRDLLMQNDTQWLKSRDLRALPGARNYQSLTSFGSWRLYNASGTATNTYKAITDCTANGGKVMDVTTAYNAGLLGTSSLATYQAAYGASTFCGGDFNSQYTALPATDRVGTLVRATKEFSPTSTGFAEVGFSRVDTFQTFQAPFFAGTTGLQKTSAGLRPFVYNINFLPGISGAPTVNPNTSAAPTAGQFWRYNGVFNDMGTRDSDIRSDTMRAVAGLTWSLGSWDFDSAAGASRNQVTNNYKNRITLSGTSSLFGVSTAPPVPASNYPFAATTAYNLDRFTTNTDAARNTMRYDFPRKSTSELTFVDTRGSTTLGKLPGGDVGLAVGAELRKESIKDVPDDVAKAGNILGQGITATDGSRTSKAVFAELSLPLVKQLELQLAARRDNYSDYGTSTVPKAGFKWRPTDWVLIRSNWGKGFRAPTLPEISKSEATFFTSVTDPEDRVVKNISGVYAGNPTLKPETSMSQTFGIVLEPAKNINLGAGYYRIDWRNVVGSKSFQSVIDASCPNGGLAFSGTPCPSTDKIIRDPASGNGVVTIYSGYENLAQRLTKGIDLDGTVRIPMESGRLSLRTDLTYVLSFKEDGTEYVGTNGGYYTYPRVRANLSADWDTGAWAVTARANYTHEYKQAYIGSYATAYTLPYQNGAMPAFVSSNTTLDLFARYQVTKNATVSASVINAFNKMPPLDIAWSFFYDMNLYDMRGRMFRLNFKYVL